MSHFSVLVIGPDVDAQLAPYHEFECTGDDNQYVQDIDITEKARQEYETHTDRRFCDPEGGSFSPYEDRFYRDPTPEELSDIGLLCGTGCTGKLTYHSKDWEDGRGYRPKVHFLPEGWEEVEIPTPAHRSFADFVADYYGYKTVQAPQRPDIYGPHKFGYVLVREDGSVQVIDRTNPNKHWDWWQIGGRWTGYFKLKAYALAGALGEPGLQSMEPDFTPPTADRADQCFLGDIDIAGMRDEAGCKAGERWDKFHAVVDQYPPIILWSEMRAKHGDEHINEARDEYHAQPAIKALAAHHGRDLIWYKPEDYAMSREECVESARESALSTFAVVKDGQWYERGRMGWWGAVSDEQDRAEWNKRFAKLIDGLPDNTMLTVVDCHI